MAKTCSNHRTIWALTSSAALVLLSWSGPAQALNLGRLKVLSGLGEPLQAEVAVVEATAAELSGLQAQIAEPSLFSQSGMEFSPALQGATVSLQTREGLPFLVVQGQQPVKETFLDLILQAQWGNGGKLKRNYALLLNSMAPNRQSTIAPVSTDQLPVSAMPTQTVTSSFNAQAPQTPNAPAAVELRSDSLRTPTANSDGVPVYKFDTPNDAVSSTSAPALATAPRAPAVVASPAQRDDGPTEVKSGDTASEIAVRNLPASVSLDQMLVAMAKANPEAFIEGNVNLVRAGSTLRMPSSTEAQKVSRQEARQIVLAQTRDFVAYTQRLARSTIQVDQTSTNEMSGRLTTPDASVKESESKPDRLTLSQATVSDGQEAKIAKEQEGQDKQKELDALQKNMAELQDLAKSKDASPGVGVNLPQPEAKPAEAEASDQELSVSNLLEKLKSDPRTIGWAAALLALMLALAWWVRRGQKRANSRGMSYAPSYDDIPATANIQPGMESSVPSGMPAGLSGLNLDLNTPPNAPVPPSVAPMVMSPPPAAPAEPAATNDTSINKLQLAQQLLQQGEKDLARALLLSAIKSDNPQVQNQAMHTLNSLQ